MNLYVRYFNVEELCHNMAEVEEFLGTIDDFKVSPKMLDDIAYYMERDATYTNRYKVSSRNYLILIKTPLDTLAEFHANGKDGVAFGADESLRIFSKYDEEQVGWYQCVKTFKRVEPMDETGTKLEYVDVSLEVLVYGTSPRDCHQKIINHLQNREDLDQRCQFPSIKDSNFTYEYKGTVLN